MHLIRRATTLAIMLLFSSMAGGHVYAADGHAASHKTASQAGGAQVVVKEIAGKYQFVPATIQVRAGATVVWTNQSDAPHTVTSDTAAFNTNTFKEDQTVSLHFATAGTFPYHCSIHPYMHGVIVVQAAATRAGGAAPAPGMVPSTGGGGTARTVVGLPRTGGAASNRDKSLPLLALGGLLGLLLILSGFGVRRLAAAVSGAP